jgi:hypothetical protein
MGLNQARKACPERPPRVLAVNVTTLTFMTTRACVVPAQQAVALFLCLATSLEMTWPVVCAYRVTMLVTRW